MMKRAIFFLLYLTITTFTDLYGQCTPVVVLTSSPGDTVCAGTPVTFTTFVIGAGATTTYEWMVNGSLISGATNTTYTYTPADADSVRSIITTSGGICTAPTTASSSRYMVVRTAPETAAITGPSALCTGFTFVYIGSIPGGVWSTADPTVTINAATGAATGMSAGTATISYTLTNMCGTSVATKVVTVGAVPPITGPNKVYCIGNTITLSNSAVGGTWSTYPPGYATINPTTGVLTAVAVGNPDVYYAFSSSCYAVLTVLVFDTPPAISGGVKTCIGNSAKLNNTAPGGTWSTTSPNASVDTGGRVTGIAAGTAIITYAIGASCFTTAVVSVEPTPSGGTINGATILCTGLTTSLTETVTSGTWASLNPAVATVGYNTGIVMGVSPGTVVITYKTPANTLNCYGSATHVMNIVAPTFTITPTSISHVNCYGANTGAITVNVSGGNPPFQYHWSNGMTGTSISGVPAGKYIISLNETNSRCTGADSFTLTQPDSMHVVVSTRADSCGIRIGSIKLDVSGATPPYAFQWANHSASSEDSLTGLVRGTYTVTIADANNCKRELHRVIEDLGCVVGIHDIITPNGDGANDKWIIEGLWLYPNNIVQIFDKWGDVVYEKTNYDADWVGQGKSGSPLPDGTYFYLLKLNDPSLPDGGIYKGLVMIKR
jgi:gliding motility-associated-like protein